MHSTEGVVLGHGITYSNVIRKYRGGSDGNGGANTTAVRPQQGQSGKGGDATPTQGRAQIAESDLLMCKCFV
jgi:hypothetical protein